MNERDIFLAATDIQDPAARQAYLDEACGDNAALRVAVEALLASHEQAGSFLEKPLVDEVLQAPAATFAPLDQTVQFSQGEKPGSNGIDQESDDEEIPLGYLSPSTKPGRSGGWAITK